MRILWILSARQDRARIFFLIAQDNLLGRHPHG